MISVCPFRPIFIFVGSFARRARFSNQSDGSQMASNCGAVQLLTMGILRRKPVEKFLGDSRFLRSFPGTSRKEKTERGIQNKQVVCVTCPQPCSHVTQSRKVSISRDKGELVSRSLCHFALFYSAECNASDEYDSKRGKRSSVEPLGCVSSCQSHRSWPRFHSDRLDRAPQPFGRRGLAQPPSRTPLRTLLAITRM